MSNPRFRRPVRLASRRRRPGRRAAKAISAALCHVEPLEPRRLLAVVPVGTPLTVNTSPYIGGNAYPSAAVDTDADGDFVVAWAGNPTDAYGYPLAGESDYDIYVRRYTAAGQPLGPEVKVNTDTQYYQLWPAVSVDAEGGFVVAWSGTGIRARRYGADGQPLGDEFPVTDTGFVPFYKPSIATDDRNGNFVIAWQAGATATKTAGIYAHRYGADGTPLGDEFRVNTSVLDSQQDPWVTMESDGRFTVTWAGGNNLRAQRYTAAGTPAGNELVLAGAPSFGGPQSVATDRTGNFVVAWKDEWDIYAQRYSPTGQSLGGRFPVGRGYVFGAQPTVATDADSNFVVAWHDGNSFLLRSYTAAGETIGGESTVSEAYGSLRANKLAVAIDDDGDVIVARHGHVYLNQYPYGQLASIRAQRYEHFSSRASVGGRIWHDVNGDGVRQAGEPGVAGRRVNLVAAAGVADTTVTFADGAYRFDYVRADYPYHLAFAPPEGFLHSPANRGDDDTLDSDYDPQFGRTAPFALPADAVDLALDAGVFIPSTLSGTLFNDRNRNGLRDPADEGVTGWTIYLDTNANARLDFAEPFTTTADGSYRFRDLYPGEYTLRFVLASGWARTAPAQGFHTLTLATAQNATGLDFGITPGLAGPEFRVNSTKLDDQYAPAVAMNRDGDFVLAWESYDQDGTGWNIYAQRYDRRGKPLGREFRVNTLTAGDQLDPAVALDDRGDVAIAWESSTPDGANAGVFARPYPHNALRSFPELRVAPAAINPAVAMDTDGDFVIAWERSAADASGGKGVYARRFHGLLRPRGALFRVGTSTDPAYNPAVAMDDDGDFVIAWQQRFPELGAGSRAVRVVARRYAHDGQPAGDPFVVRAPAPFTFGDGAPSVAMDADGDFVIAWNAYTLFVFENYVYIDFNVRARRYTAAGVPAPEVDVAYVYDDPPQLPAVAMDRAGNFVVAWDNFSWNTWETGWNVHARKYDAAGTPLGTAFRVNTTPAGDQVYPAIAMDDAGDFVVAWNSFLQDGSDFGIYAQRFAAVPTKLPVPAPHPKKPIVGSNALLDPIHSLLSGNGSPDLLALRSEDFP